MTSNTTHKSPQLQWTSPEGKAVVCKIVEELIPQWGDGPLKHQVNAWVWMLDRMLQLTFMPIGIGKMALFYVPVLIARYMHQNPDPRFKPLPVKPVALVVVLLNELGNNHVSNMILFKGSLT